jgi:hypothetical protein
MSTRRKPPSKAAKQAAPPNISAISRQYGVSRETVRKIRDHGINLADDAAVTNAIAVSKAKLAAPAAPATDGESYSEARRRRAVADANLAELRAQREAKSLVDAAAVQEFFHSVIIEFRSRLLAMRGDLIHQLHGLSEPGIYKVLDKSFCELLESIATRRPIPK